MKRNSAVHAGAAPVPARSRRRHRDHDQSRCTSVMRPFHWRTFALPLCAYATAWAMDHRPRPAEQMLPGMAHRSPRAASVLRAFAHQAVGLIINVMQGDPVRWFGIWASSPLLTAGPGLPHPGFPMQGTPVSTLQITLLLQVAAALYRSLVLQDQVLEGALAIGLAKPPSRGGQS